MTGADIAVALFDEGSLNVENLRAENEALKDKLMDGKGHICAVSHEHRGCAFCQRDKAMAENVAALAILGRLADWPITNPTSELLAIQHAAIAFLAGERKG